MPYSSSIQLVNDANGEAYAFLADNGSIWQCQWDSQAQIWAKAQQVPQAFGGEKLQALYLNNLWPTPDTPTASGSNPTTTAFIPGIVLAYRVGEGSSAEVFASIGGWGSDGQLSWSVPVQLTDDQLDDHDFALVAAEGSTGGFSLVVQKQEASTPISTVRDQLKEANTTTPGISKTTLSKRAQETLGADRSDSDLYTTEFNLGFSDSKPGSVVLTAGTPAVAVSAPIVAAPAANPLPLGPQPFTGNTQLSRQQLNAAMAQPSGTNPSSTSLMGATPSAGNTQTQDTSQNTRGKLPVKAGGTTNSGGQWRAGLLGPATLTRWEIGDEIGSGRHHGKGTEGGEIGKVGDQAISGGPEEKAKWQFRWEGSFGIRNIGVGATSESTAKLTIGIGTDNEENNKKTARKAVTDATGEGLSKKTWYAGVGGLLDTKYFYDSSEIAGASQLWTRSPSQTLTEIISHESIGFDGLFKYRYIAPGGNSVKFIIEDYIGYLLSQEVENQENIPAWLADVGFYAGAVGNIEKYANLAVQGIKGGKGFKTWITNKKNGIAPVKDPGALANRAEGQEESGLGLGQHENVNKFNAIYGTLLSVFAPASLWGLKIKYGNDIDLGFGTGWQNELEVTLRLLYHSIAGVELKISNSTEIFDAKSLLETRSSDDWADYFYLAAGAALPHGTFLPLFSDYIELGSGESEQTTTINEEGTASINTQQDTPLVYAPSSGGNTYIPPSSNTTQQTNISQPIATTTSSLQQISLAISSNPPITLRNGGTSLNPGTYEKVTILGVTIDGTVDTAAQATLTVDDTGSIKAGSFEITRAGNYLALPSIPSTTSPDQTSYALLLDVFSTNNSLGQRIANSPSLESLSANPGNPFANLPLITLEAGENSPLSTADIESIQLIAVDPASQSPNTIYPVYDPTNNKAVAPSTTNNATYIYSNIGVALFYTPITENGSTGTSQEISLLNPGVTATVSISGGVIQKVDLSQPILFADIEGATSEYSVQLTLPDAVQDFVGGNNQEAATPTFSVTPQSLAVNNLTEEEQFSAQAGQANSGVFLSAGLSDQLPLSGSMGAWPVQNRVTYLSPSESNPRGQEILYLNGFAKVEDDEFEPLSHITPEELTPEAIYSNPNIFFSAASNPTAAKIPGAGPTTIVAWIESSKPAVPLSNPENGSESFQSYMESIYGSQRINFRIKNNNGWAVPEINALYDRDGWVIDHLHAFNAADPFNPGQELTWVAWSETSIDAIQGVVEDFGFESPNFGKNPIQAVIKTGWINPSKTDLSNITWKELFSANDGSTTIQEVPWNPEAHVGLGISDISIGSLSQTQSDGSLLFTPTISWSQDVRTPYKESVLNDAPYLYLDFAQLQNGVNAINIGSTQSGINTETIASETGLDFSIIGALPKSQATAVRNIDGSGTLSTGLGSNNRMIDQIIRNMPSDDSENQSDPIATPTAPYTIEFWAQLQPGLNPNGAGLVALGQPSSTAIGPAEEPEGWLMSSSFVVDQITFNEAAGLGQIDSIPAGVSGTDVYGWGWAVIAQGANTSAMNGNGGNNLYSNSLILKNLVSGDKIHGVNEFLDTYRVGIDELVGLNGLAADTIVTVPSTQLQFSGSSLNAINFDTSSSVLNEGYLIGNPSPDSNLGTMLNTLWEFQLKTGESKVNFSQKPTTLTEVITEVSPTLPGALTSESYSGFALDFALVRGSAVSVNGEGQLVFDFGPNNGYLSSEDDLRDGNWHYIVASYLPDYETATINGSTVEIPSNKGTATLYINNQLVASQSDTTGAYLPTNINDIAVLLSNNAGGAIDQLAFYDKALSAIDFTAKQPGTWPQPSSADVLSLMASAGYSLPNQESDLSLLPGAVTSHWLSHTVNPNDAALATYYSILQPSGANSYGWSEASTFNPQLESQSTSTSFSKSGSLQDSLVIEIPTSNWTQDSWNQAKQSSNIFFNPANQQLTGISVKITNTNGGQVSNFSLTADQVLIGDENIETLQPFATDNNFQYTVLSDKPSFSLLIPKDQLPASSDPLKDEYTAQYTLSFNGTETDLTVSSPVTLNEKAGNSSSILNRGYAKNSTIFTTREEANKAIATAAVIEQAPLQLKYVDSGEIFKSAQSAALANDSAASSPASSFGQSQVIGKYLTTTKNTYASWIAIAQPFSTNAISNPAGRIWVQYTGEYTTGTNSAGNPTSTPSSSPATAPTTWLNALANSNFSPDTPNLPLLGNSNNPSSSGGLLIQADPTDGWGQNFGQNMLVADINGDKVDELIIGAPQANGGGQVIVISGSLIQQSLKDGSIINLANISAIADDVIIFTPAEPQTIDAEPSEDASIAGFGSALAYDLSTSTLWIGAPNYLQSPSVAENANQDNWQPIGAVYTIAYNDELTITNNKQPISLQPTALGTQGSTTVNGPTGSPLTSSWGSQLGTAIAVNGSGAIAISAPGIEASLLYSGTEVVQKKSQGQKHVSDPYGNGALIKIQLPTQDNNYNISSTQGTANGSLVDVVNQNKTSKNDYSAKESTYMQNLRSLQVDNIASATVLNNQAIQTGAVGAVYLFQNSADITGQSTPVLSAEFAAEASQGGATFYGAQPWNTIGASGFGSSLAFGDVTDTNINNILAVGASQTGGSGAVYLFDTNLSFTAPTGEKAPPWIPDIILGATSSTYARNQYLAHLASSFTLYGAASGDQFGNGLVNLGDINGDKLDDLLIQAYNASSGAGNGYILFGNENLNASIGTKPNPGVSGVATGIAGLVNFADGSTPITTPILSELGQGMAGNTGQGTFGSGDANGDGLNDIPLGSGPNGNAYLTWGQQYLEAINNLQLSKLTSDSGYRLTGLASTQQGSLVSIGDFNGDGYGDFISIQSGDEATTGLSTVRIELGGNTATILADYPYNYYTFSVANGTEVLAAGDINGDGFDDIALFLEQNLSSANEGNQGAGSTTGILYGRDSQDLPLGSGFGLLAPVGNDSQPLMALPGTDIASGLTDAAPAFINVGNTIYAVVKGYGSGDTSLYFNQSLDGGSTWTSWSNITNTHSDLASNSSPSLAFFNNKLYLAYLNTDTSPALSISSWDPASDNPAAWSAPTQISDGNTDSFSSSFSPQLIDRGDALGVIWVDANGELQATYSTTPASNTTLGALGTPTPWTVVDGGSSPAIPALARNGNTVYMAVQGNGDANIYWTMSADSGVNWANWQALPVSMTTASAPSLAVVDGTLYLSYLGDGNNEINITSLTDASANTWSEQYLIPDQSATYASLISETIGSTTQLAVYYVSNDSTDRILKAYSSTPSSANNWTSDLEIEYDDGSGVQTASGPLALATFNGQTYIAYQGGTTTSPSDLIYLASSSSASTTNTGSAWSTQGTFNANVATGLGLTTSPDGLILSYGDASQTSDLQLRELSFDQASGSWSITDRYTDTLPSALSNEVAILGLSAGTGPALLLAGINSESNDYSIQTSLLYGTDTDPSWSTPVELLERVETNGIPSYPQIIASAAPSFTWIGQQGVLAVNENGTIKVFNPVANSLSWELVSTFTSTSEEAAISSGSGPVLTTTDSGLALTYGNSDNTITLQRIDLVDNQGNALSGTLPWVSTILSPSEGGLSSSLATVPLLVDGNLLLANVRTGSQNGEIWLNAVPNLGNPDSTTWLNSTVQLSDGQGGWSISQQADSTLTSLSPSWSVVSNGQSPEPPAFAEANGVLYAAVRGTNNDLYWSSSSNSGQTWAAWQNAGSFSTDEAPSLAVVDGTVYLAYLGNGNSEINIAWLNDAATNSWSNQYQIPNQGAETICMLNENNSLVLYYQGTNDNIYRTATTTPTSNTGWQENSIQYSNGAATQTCSGQLVATILDGATYLAYQGGTSSNQSNTIYLTTSATQSTGSSWSLINDVPQPGTAAHSGVGLTTLNDTLVLSYADEVNSKPVVALHQGLVSGGNWRGAPYALLQSAGTTASPQASLFVPSGSSTVLVSSINGNSSPVNDITTTFAAAQPLSQLLTSGQTGSTLTPVGDLNNDGFADLLVSANNVAANFSSGRQLATGVRVISGAATSSQLLADNDSSLSDQTVQLASPFSQGSQEPVSSITGANPANGSLNLGIAARNGSAVSAINATVSAAELASTSGSVAEASALLDGLNPSTTTLAQSNGWGDAALNGTGSYGDLNGDGRPDFFDPAGDGAITTIPGLNYSIWSIRAAGDVNGNGVDDVLLSLAPQGPAYVPTSSSQPSALQSVLVDGSLFNIDTSTNSFRLDQLKKPLNPYNASQLYDIGSTSTNDYLPELQNWFDPILAFQPGALTAASTANSVNPDSAQSWSPPSAVVSPEGDTYLFFSGADRSGTNKASGLWMAYQDNGGNWQQTSLSAASTCNNTTPSAAYFQGKLYVAYTDTNQNINIAVCSGSPNDPSATWSSYQVTTTTNESTIYSPTLIAEDNRLALYFPSNNNPGAFNSLATSYEYIRYLYSLDPASGNWGASFNTAAGEYTGISGQLNYEVTSPIAATTFQGRTVLAFRSYASGGGFNAGNGSIVLLTSSATAPSATVPRPALSWNEYNTNVSNVNGVGLTTDQSLLYLTTGHNFASSNPASWIWSLAPTTLNKGEWSMDNQQTISGPSLFNDNDAYGSADDGDSYNVATVVPFMANGHLMATWTGSNENVQIGNLDTTVSTPIQQSLAGYSLDGNIDVNGDGFADVLISDPTSPSQGVDNQYVLFGGDYLNIASEVGTPGNDRLSGTPLADVIYTLGGSDVVESDGGADVIYTGSGNDQISITGPGFVRVDGGSGFDTLLLEGLTNQDYDFRLNIDSPEFFAGTKLKDIELINSANYGSNTLSFDAAAINAINPDRILFLTPDANDFIVLSNEFNRNTQFDVNFDGLLWNAYAAGATSSPTSDNPALVYVLNPQGTANTEWLANVSTTSLSSNDNSNFTVASLALLAAPDESNNNEIAPFVTTSSTATPSTPIPTSSAVQQTLSFGSGLTLTSYRTQPSDGLARFSISGADTSQPRALLYASSSKNSSAEPGRHYTAVAGLAILPKNQPSLDITVPINSEAFSQLRGATLSLQVEEIPYSDRLVPLHLLIEPAATGEAGETLPPVLSGFSLNADPSGSSATLELRADTNDGSIDALNLTIARRSSADATSTIAVAEPTISDAPTETSSAIDTSSVAALFSDSAATTAFSASNALSGFDQDNINNDQVALEVQFNIAPEPSDAYVALVHSDGTTLPLEELGRAAAAPPPVDPPAPPVNPPAPPINNPVPGTTNIQPTDNDGDGLREVTWAADGYGVDGNRDGVLDAEQAQVAGISLVNDGASSSDYGALAVSGDVVLRDVAIQPTASDGTVPVTLADGSTVSALLPTGISNTFAGSLSFTVSGLTPGGTTDALIYLPVGYSGDGNAYVRYNYNSGRFEEYLDTQGNRLYAFTDTDGDGFGDAITLTLADGDAQWDGDGLANGSVVDPGFLASGAIEITGNGQNNRLSGNILANQIRGKGKRDLLIGDLGDDILRGGKGDDRLNGGEGADILIGGHGADRFRYSALIDSTVERSDTLQFGRRDQIDLRQLDANTTRKGNQAFSFIADAKFSGQAGELRLFESRLLADVDGDRQADFALNLRSNQAFSADVLSL